MHSLDFKIITLVYMSFQFDVKSVQFHFKVIQLDFKSAQFDRKIVQLDFKSVHFDEESAQFDMKVSIVIGTESESSEVGLDYAEAPLMVFDKPRHAW